MVRVETERERRFLVADESVLRHSTWMVKIIQGYMFNNEGYAARIRRVGEVDEQGQVVKERALPTLRGPRVGADRAEFEVGDVPLDLAVEFLRRIPFQVIKQRHGVISDEETWDIDVFAGDNEGLVIAECEFQYVPQDLVVPKWAGAEVTDDPRFNNEELAFHPLRLWRQEFDAEWLGVG